MIKCTIKSQGTVRVRAEGTPQDITNETLVLIKEVLRGLSKQDPELAKECRNVMVAALLDPNSPLWKEE